MLKLGANLRRFGNRLEEEEGGGCPAVPRSPNARFSREFFFFPRRQNKTGTLGHGVLLCA